MRHYSACSAEERRRRRKRRRRRRIERKNAKSLFFTSRGAYVNLRYTAMLYTHSISNQPYTVKSLVCVTHQIWCATMFSIRTPFLACNAHHYIKCVSHTNRGVSRTPTIVCLAHQPRCVSHTNRGVSHTPTTVCPSHQLWRVLHTPTTVCPAHLLLCVMYVSEFCIKKRTFDNLFKFVMSN